MKKTIVTCSVVISILIFTLFFWKQARISTEPVASETISLGQQLPSVKDNSLADKDGLDRVNLRGEGQSQRQTTGNSRHPFPELPRSRKGLPLDEDPFVAESLQEQQWLDRNGYPNAAQWKTYSAASDGLLGLAAANGDTVAGVMLDGRALLRGDPQAADRLLKAAEEGSTFALMLLQAYMAGSPKGDPSFAYSLSKVMEMMGDTRIALARDISFREPLSTEMRLSAEAEALVLFKQLEAQSKKRPFVDPRPFP